MSAAAPSPPPPVPRVTHSLRRDRVLFGSILALMLLLSPRLRVYHSVTVVDVSLQRVEPGQREGVTLPTPISFARPGNGYWAGESVMRRIEPRIRRYMEDSEWARLAAPGTRFVWTVRWSENSLLLDRVDRVTWEVPAR